MASTEDERHKFERFAELADLPVARGPITDGNGKYIDPMTQVAWTAWQSRAFLNTKR